MQGYNPKEFKLSYSAMAQATCLYRFHLRYVRGVEKIYPSQPLQVGQFIHAGLAAFNTTGRIEDGKRAIINVFGAWRLKANPVDDELSTALQNLEDAKNIFERTAQYQSTLGWTTAVIPDTGELAVELKLDVPLRNWKGFTGFCDLVIKDRQANLWVVDYKSRAAIQPDENEEYNAQLAIYQYMLKKQYGLDVVGTITFQIRREVPKQPKRNKDGSMSRAACATDWPTYKQALIDVELDPADYADMQEKLNEREYFRLSTLYRSPETLTGLWDMVQRQAWNISAVKHPIRNMTGTHCLSCWAKEWCVGELTNPNFTGLPELYHVKQ